MTAPSTTGDAHLQSAVAAKFANLADLLAVASDARWHDPRGAGGGRRRGGERLAMARRARPTLRCLREDLGQAIPPAGTPLDEVPHPLLAKASERFADDGTPRERIASADDQVLFKVKVQRCRDAVEQARGAQLDCQAEEARETKHQDRQPRELLYAIAGRFSRCGGGHVFLR